ncbi:MAG: VWA domain-containing protein [Myxococcales bacterium]|nr:VWA domain-containing protein [Myxococcales bacterium]
MLSALLIAPILFSSSGCADRSLAIVGIDSVAEERVDFAVNENRDVDLLFVVDNSNSMEREQASLAEKFSNVIDALANYPDGLPSVHIAVVSTDVGVGEGQNICSPLGDNGAFQGSQCSALDGDFLRSIANEDGSRAENFTGSLPETFACMATLGLQGCGFEQPLESMRRALSGPQSEGFLREHAYLAVVIVTDEDDCSAKDTGIFAAQSQDLSSALGPAKSFRCFEFGVQCDQDGDQVRTIGPRSGCVPRDNSPYLYDVDEYVQFLYGLKRSPEQTLVATIAGDLTPIAVTNRHDDRQNLDYVALEYSCTEADAEAVPPIRLSAFVRGFAQNSSQETSLCAPDLSGALDDIATLIRDRIASCLTGNLVDTDEDTPGIQPECVVTLTGPDEPERRISECQNQENPQASDNLPCYTLTNNPVCTDTPTSQSPKVHHAEGLTVPVGTNSSLRCLAP